MNTPTSTKTATSSATTSTATEPFTPLDFIPQFIAGISVDVVLRTANGSSILSTIKEGDIVTPTEVQRAFDNIAGYFYRSDLSPEMDVNRVQQYAAFLIEIAKHQHRHGVPARITACELGNAVAALQQMVQAQMPAGKN